MWKLEWGIRFNGFLIILESKSTKSGNSVRTWTTSAQCSPADVSQLELLVREVDGVQHEATRVAAGLPRRGRGDERVGDDGVGH